jgi:uncharacterized protein
MHNKKLLKVVSDATAIVNLSILDKLDLLKTFYHEIIISNAVYNELLVGTKIDKRLNKFKNLDWIKIKEVKNATQLSLVADLDKGEAETIILAKEINADLVIIDELIGRNYAELLNLKIT